jgi:hypothetical protein
MYSNPVKYNRVLLVAAMLVISVCTLAQFKAITPADRKILQAKEDSLRIIGDSMINAVSPGKRFLQDSQFVKTLVRALKTKHSFYYPFEQLETISRLYAPDSSFRIFTWQMKKDEYFYLQRGAIQMRTADGSLKLYPLFDASMFTKKPNDSLRNKSNWIGAIYYNIIRKEHQGKAYYTLLGFDDFTVGSNRKWLDVLHFDAATGEPLFGGRMISFKEDTGKLKNVVMDRFHIEYKKEARTTFNYNPEMDMIIYDHLISETEQPERKESYIPDGDFEGFQWKNGQWVHVDKVFDFKLKEGDVPIEQQLRNKNGEIDEEKLIEQSIRNAEKNKTGTTPKTTPAAPEAPIKKKKG